MKKKYNTKQGIPLGIQGARNRERDCMEKKLASSLNRLVPFPSHLFVQLNS